MMRTSNVKDPFLDNPPFGPLLPLPDYNPSATNVICFIHFTYKYMFSLG